MSNTQPRYYALKPVSEKPEKEGVYATCWPEKNYWDHGKFKDGKWHYFHQGRDAVESRWIPYTEEESINVIHFLAPVEWETLLDHKFNEWAEMEGWEEHTDGRWTRDNILGDRIVSVEEKSKAELFSMFTHYLSPVTEDELVKSHPLLRKMLERAYTRGWVSKHQHQKRGQALDMESEIKEILEWDGFEKPSPFSPRNIK